MIEYFREENRVLRDFWVSGARGATRTSTPFGSERGASGGNYAGPHYRGVALCQIDKEIVFRSLDLRADSVNIFEVATLPWIEFSGCTTTLKLIGSDA
jgi:hypothetical protein